MIQPIAPVKDTDVIIVIYKADGGTRVTMAHGPEASLRLWRGRWVRSGHIARQVMPDGTVREYGND